MELIRELNDGVQANNAEIVWNKYLKEYGNQDREFFIVLGLDSKNTVIYREIVSVGTLNTGLAHPREVFKKAIMMSANSIIIAHNHPSKDLEPSKEDVATTKRIEECGELLGISLLDSIVFSDVDFETILRGFKR